MESQWNRYISCLCTLAMGMLRNVCSKHFNIFTHFPFITVSNLPANIPNYVDSLANSVKTGDFKHLFGQADRQPNVIFLVHPIVFLELLDW